MRSMGLVLGMAVVAVLLIAPGASMGGPGSESGSYAVHKVVNQDQFEGNWKQFKGDLKQKWGKFTDDDLLAIEGRYDKLEGKIQERYGDRKQDVEEWVDEWFDKRDKKKRASK